MSDHLVEVPNEGWGNWGEAVARSRVQFTQEQLELGEELISCTQFPTRNRVLNVHDFCSTSSVSEMYSERWMLIFKRYEPAHPLYLLELMRGIEGAKDITIFGHMQYQVAMSHFLLADAKGRNYILLLRNDGVRYYGSFKPLFKDDYLPRCTHIRGYVAGQEPDHHTSPMFRLREDGKYGPYRAP